MKRSIEIYLGEHPQQVGTLHYNQDGSRENSAFEYSKAWISANDSYPIEPALKMVSGPQYHKSIKDGSKFHGCIADTEPDGWGSQVIMRDHAKRRERQQASGGVDLSPPSALAFLLAVDDFSRIGAIRLREGKEWQRSPPQDSQRTTPPIIELPDLIAASRAVEYQTETEADLAYLRGRGIPLEA